MKYIFTAYIFFATLMGSAQSATRVNATNATPTTMPSTANIMWIDGSDPNHTIRTSSSSTTVYTKSQADNTFMKNTTAADSINAMKNTISANQAATNGKFNDYYTKTESDARYVMPSALTWSNISGKPSFFDGNYNSLSNRPALFSGAYADLTGKPTLFSGAYSDLTGKPSLSAVATTGSYNDLSNKPNIPSVNNASVIAALGYTPLQTESDPTVSATVKAITATNVNNWNAAATASGKTRVYDKNGLISSNGMPMTDTFTISTATPTISFSALMTSIGATSFKIRSAIGYRVGAVTGTSPQVAVTGLTSNSASFIINQTNTATVTLLSVNVLSGLPTILAPDPQNVKLVLDVVFY